MAVSCSKIVSDRVSETAVLGHVWRGGRPAQRAYVRVARPDGEYVSEVRCDPAGAFYIPVLPGAWKVICFGLHGYRVDQELQVGRGDQFDLEFLLEDAA